MAPRTKASAATTAPRRRAPSRAKPARRRSVRGARKATVRPKARATRVTKATTRPAARSAAAPKVSPLKGKPVDAYIDKHTGWQADVLWAIDGLVRAAAPAVTASIKWGQPVYDAGGPIASVQAHKDSVNLHFWKGVRLEDPAGLLQGQGTRLRYLRLRGIDDIDPVVIQGFVRQAVALNEREGSPMEPPRR